MRAKNRGHGPLPQALYSYEGIPMQSVRKSGRFRLTNASRLATDSR